MNMIIIIVLRYYIIIMAGKQPSCNYSLTYIMKRFLLYGRVAIRIKQ